MNKFVHLLLPFGLFSIPFFLCAQNSSQQTPAATPAAPAQPPAAPPAKLQGWALSALGDGYFTFNFNHPASRLNQLQNFNLNYGQPELSLAKITIDKSDEQLGLHVDAGFGETLRFIHAADPAPNGIRYIEQLYLIWKPKRAHGAEIDFGEFVTSAGAEVIEASFNRNYSRSLLFALATPYYHFGFRASVPVTKSYTAGIQVVNA